MPFGFPASMLGVIVSGDIGSSTIYTDRFGKTVEFPKSPPKTPPSPRQALLRKRFREAQQAYMSLSPQLKADWEYVARKSQAVATGQNLYIHFAMVHDYEVLQTVNRQCGTSVPPPPAV